MSNTPSQTDTLRSAAATATHAVAETIEPSEEKQKSRSDDKESYKDRLDKAAYEYEGHNAPPKNETLVKKASSYIPGLSSLTGQTPSSETTSRQGPMDEGKPPTRPDHDVQVEEFLKGQYKSKSGDAMPNVGE